MPFLFVAAIRKRRNACKIFQLVSGLNEHYTETNEETCCPASRTAHVHTEYGWETYDCNCVWPHHVTVKRFEPQ